MKCASILSTLPDPTQAVAEVKRRASEALVGRTADLAVVFATADLAPALGPCARELRRAGLARGVIGCTAESVVGEDREVEGGPALSLWAACLPGVEARPVRLAAGGDMTDGATMARGVVSAGARSTALVVLGDPFSFPADAFLQGLNEAAPGLPICGGMASASHTAGGNRLVLDDEEFRDGAVGVALSGPISIRAVVSQGCRPIGRTMIVTRSEGSMIRELGRRPALEVLREVFEELSPADQSRVQQGLHIGRVINEYQDSFQRGDFLVRNVLGADDAGGIAVTDNIRVGRTVQFHVRDADSADEDLRTLLENERTGRPSARVGGALLFTCNGRGTRLFPAPNHDVEALHRVLGPVAVGGFFAMGEIGPVGGQNFVHGFTASVVLFEEPSDGPT